MSRNYLKDSERYTTYIKDIPEDIYSIILTGYFPYHIICSLLAFNIPIIHVQNNNSSQYKISNSLYKCITENIESYIYDVIDNTKKEYAILSWNYLSQDALIDIISIYALKYGIIRQCDDVYFGVYKNFIYIVCDI